MHCVSRSMRAQHQDQQVTSDLLISDPQLRQDFRKLYTHLHSDRWMGAIPFDYDVLALELVDHLDFPPPLDRWERKRLPLQLDLQRFQVISVYMRVAKLNDEFACLGIGDMRDHVCQEGV